MRARVVRLMAQQRVGGMLNIREWLGAVLEESALRALDAQGGEGC